MDLDFVQVMRVVVVPVLADNYAYLLIDEASGQAACVDPAEAHIVLASAAQEGVTIVAVLTTHHHADHAGGNGEIAAKVHGVRIFGGELDNVMACTDPLADGATFAIGSIQIKALHTPGHTRGSISYYCTEGPRGLVFTGDTMFVGGCGRIFEGTPQDMYHSLVDVLGSLPGETEVYVGHDYTVKNLEFAASVEARNDNLQQMLEWARAQKVERKFSVPSTMRNEWMINPFLRSTDPVMQSVCPGCSPVEIFARLRRQKDRF